VATALVVTSANQPVLDNVPGFRETVMEKLMIKRLGQPDTGKSAGSNVTVGARGAVVAAGAADAAAAVADAAAPDDGSATLYGPANEDLMTIRTIERNGDDLVLKGQAYGSLPLTAKLRPEQARRLLKLTSFSLIPFLLTFLFRRSKPKDAP
jgi:hypothetical protein